MDGDNKFCQTDEGIRYIDITYSTFLRKKALDKQGELGIIVDDIDTKDEKSKPVLTFNKKEGDIKCYLQDRMYHSDEWVGAVGYHDNMFTYYSKFKEERITVSGPCVVREEKE